MSAENVNLAYIKHKVTDIIKISDIIAMQYFEFDKKFDFEVGTHSFWEFVYVDSGEIIATVDDKKFTLKSDEAIFFSPYESHKVQANGNDVANVFIMNFGTNSKPMHAFKNRVIKLPEKLKKYIAKILSEGEKTFEMPFNDPYLVHMKLKDDPPFGGMQMIKTYMEQLIIHLLRHEEATDVKGFSDNDSAEELALLAAQLIKENIYGRISVEEICEKLHYSKAYISKIFKRNYGCTLTEFYAKMKIKEAKKLIREGKYNFTMISDMLSFSNVQYFTRVFKRVANMTPGEYEKSVQS